MAYTKLRSTYNHEVDSARGFRDFNDPGRVRGPRDFQRAAHKIGYTFNWLYTDARDIAYYNSGNNPVRSRNVDRDLPTRGLQRFEWQGFNAGRLTARYTPFAQHPQTVNQSYLTSWNNKQAPGYRAADDNYGFSSIYRSQPLDDRIVRGTRGARRMSLAKLVDAMESAATVDLRGDKVLPWMLRVVGRPGNARLRAGVEELIRWQRSGAHRRDRDGNGRYEYATAIRIMDAWWPRAVRAQFEPTLGARGFATIASMIGLDNEPNNHGGHMGSAYQNGWYGFVQRDLRSTLGVRVRGRYSRRYCGRGSLARCRTALRGTLAQAIGTLPSAIYQDDTCADAGRANDQKCFDAISHRALGAVTQPLIDWVNRPTFQQIVEIRRRRPATAATAAAAPEQAGASAGAAAP